MKYFKFLFLAFTLMIMSSCSSNDDGDNSPTSGELLGTWEGVSVDYTSTTTFEFQGESFTAEAVGAGYDVNYTITFAEPNVLTTNGAYSVELTTTTMGQTQVQNFENLEFASDGTWTRNGDDLTFVTDADTQNLTITELTGSTMTLVTVDTSTIVEQGITYVVNTNVIATYRR